jgi:hypothetical protein
MNRFLKTFLRDDLGQSIQLAGFGKHPAWDDHIDDLGLTTESLVIIRRALYSEGIGRLVSSGAWKRLEEKRQAPEFDHRFVWSRDAQSVVGGIWASSDGKGRAHFPMIVCLQTGLNGWRAVHSYLPVVEDLGALCKVAKDQRAFRGAFVEAQRRLGEPGSRTEASDLGARKQTIVDGIVALAQGLKVYKKRGIREGDRSMHFRLPAVSVRDSLEFWAGYLETRIGTGFPCLTIASTGLGPVDVITGEPVADDFFCLRAPEKSLPMSVGFTEDKRLADIELDAKVYIRSFEFGSIEPSDNRQAGRWWPF